VPAYGERQQLDRPLERLRALFVAVLVQGALAFALFQGLRVEIDRPRDLVQRLIRITLPQVPPAIEPLFVPPKAPQDRPQAARERSAPAPKPARAPRSVVPFVPVQSPAAPPGGGATSGSAGGAGSGEGNGVNGTGAGGGTELEQVAGEITARDYPRYLGNAGIGGRVGVSFTVGVNGRVTRCAVTHSSGVPELDAITCRLIMQRFRYRPSTDRFGRPVSDVVDGEHEWTAGPR